MGWQIYKINYLPISHAWGYCSFWKTIKLGLNLIFIFMTISQILTSSWTHLFKSKKSFLIILFFQALPTATFLVGGICLIACAKYIFPAIGIDIQNIEFITRFTTPLWLSVIAIAGLLLLLVWLTFQLVCSYLSALGLSWNYENKTYTIKTLLKSWKGMWSWAGTGLSVAVQFLWIIVVGLLVALWFAYFKDYLALVPAVLTVGVFLFFAVLLCFSMPIYFFEWKKYFQATKASRQLVRGRWWKTFGYAVLVIFIATFVSIVFAIIEITASWGGQFLPTSLADSRVFSMLLWVVIFVYYVIQMFVNMVVQIFIQSTTFALYHFYKSAAVVNTRASKKTK